MVYIREAHPSDGWQMNVNVREGVVYESPKTTEARRVIAKNCVRELGLHLPTLLDGMDDAMMKAYNGWPNRVYILGGDGIVQWKGPWGPRGVSHAKFEEGLETLLALPGGGRFSDRAPRLGVVSATPVRTADLRLAPGLAPARGADGIHARVARKPGAPYELAAEETLLAAGAFLTSAGIEGTGRDERIDVEALVSVDGKGSEGAAKRSALFRIRYRHYWKNVPVEGDALELTFDRDGLREVRGTWHRLAAAEGEAPETRSSLEIAKEAKMMKAVARPMYLLREGAFHPVFRLTQRSRTKDVDIAR